MFLDDSQLLSARDDQFTHGRTGLRTYRAAADFDNVIVSASPFARYSRQVFESTDPGVFRAVDGDWRMDPVEEPDHYRQFSLAGDARTLDPAVAEDQVITTTIRVDAFAAPVAGREYWAGVLARYQDTRNYYYLSLRSSNQVSLRRVVNGQITVLKTAPLSVAVGRDYRVRMEVVGQKLRAFVDGQMVLEATDSTFSSGRSGLVTFKAGASFPFFTAFQP